MTRALTDEEKAARAAARKAQREAQRIHRFHLAHPWKRKTEGAGATELDKLFTGARLFEGSVATGHAASKRGYRMHGHPRHVSRVTRRVRRRGGAAAAPLGYADRLANYQAQNDARTGYTPDRWRTGLTPAQNRRLAKKQRHLAASRVPAKQKIISERAATSQAQQVIRKDTRHIEHGPQGKLSWGQRAARQLHNVQRRSQRGA
jgi:hypothetical protein